MSEPIAGGYDDDRLRVHFLTPSRRLMSLLHSKVDLFASNSFGTVANLRTYENAVGNSHSETATVIIRLSGSDGFGFSLRRVCVPSSSVDPNGSEIVVESILPNSPAANSGRIQIGDRILAVNGKPTGSLVVDEVYEVFENSGGVAEILLEFDVFETCSVYRGVAAVRLVKQSPSFGIDIQMGAQKGEPIAVKSVVPASIAHRSGALEAGDLILTIDDIPMDNCSADEAARLLHTSQHFLKLHILKGGIQSDLHRSPPESQFSVDLRPNGQTLGLLVNEDCRVLGIEENGFCWRSGTISCGDRIVSIDGCPTDHRSVAELQTLINLPKESVHLCVCRPLLSRRSDTTDWRGANNMAPNRLNLIDIQKVIGDLTSAVQNREIQILRSFEKVEDQLLSAKPLLRQRPDDAPKRSAQRLSCFSSDSFSSSGFGSGMSQQSAPETPSIPILCSPISLFDSRSKNVLLLRDPEQIGFGFSITETNLGTVIVNAVKPNGVAERNGVLPKDRILQVNGVNVEGMRCAQLLSLFDTDILELVLFNEDIPPIPPLRRCYVDDRSI